MHQEQLETTEKPTTRADFGSTIKRWRHHRGISQEQLAEKAGLHRTYISDVERGARNLSLQSIDKLAHALEVSVAALFLLPDAGQSGATSDADGRELVDILLVEDNPDDIELSLMAFKQARFANRVQVLHDGIEALDYLFRRGDYAQRTQDEDPPILLLDLNLPKLDGLEVLRQLRAAPQTRAMPVVILTGSQSDQDMEECRSLGVETYIVKPVNFQRLSEVTPRLNLNWALLRHPQTLT